MKWPRYVVVVGCGRLGSLLAGRLSQGGSGVVVIDRSEEALDLLPLEFTGFRIHGDATELEVLRAARIEQADCLIATTENDNVNMMVTQVAKVLFSVPHAVARVCDPRREGAYREVGIETVNTTELSGQRFMQLLLATGKTGREGE